MPWWDGEWVGGDDSQGNPSDNQQYPPADPFGQTTSYFGSEAGVPGAESPAGSSLFDSIMNGTYQMDPAPLNLDTTTDPGTYPAGEWYDPSAPYSSGSSDPSEANVSGGGHFDATGNYVQDPSTLSKIGDALKSFLAGSGVGSGSASQSSGAPNTTAAGAAAGAAQGRKSEAELALERDRNRNQAYSTEQNAMTQAGAQALAQQEYLSTVPNVRLSTAAHGDQLANARDVGIQGGNPLMHVIQFTGGKRPSNLSTATRQLGANTSADMLKAEQSPSPLRDPYAGVLPTPTEMNMPAASLLDQFLGYTGSIPAILNGAGNVGSIVSLLAKAFGG